MTSFGPDTFEIRILVHWYIIITCIWIIKNLTPKEKRWRIYSLLIYLNRGDTALNCLWNRIIEAINRTIIGGIDIANAKAAKDGGYNFIRIVIMISDKKLPITGKAADNATFWYAEITAQLHKSVAI